MHQLSKSFTRAPYVLLLLILLASSVQARPGDEIPLAPLAYDYVLDASFLAQQGRVYEAWTKARLGDRTAKIDPMQTKSMDEYDVYFYDLDIELNAVTKILSGTVRMDAWVVGTELSSLELHLLSSTMNVSAVQCDGQNVVFNHANDLLDIT